MPDGGDAPAPSSAAALPVAPPPGESAQEAFDRRIQEQKAQHSCLRRLDEFMFCMSVTNQMSTLYQTGTYNDCRTHFTRWQTCLRSRLKKPLEGQELLDEERRATHTGTHVFMFRPAYAEEARLRYGIEPSAPRVDAATPVPEQR